MKLNSHYDLIVIGAGHAGCEAAYAGARMGFETLLLTMDPRTVALMSCNPAIGGLAKGHLVREIDALGGVMGQAIDATGIQFRMLNMSKGPAVRGPRAQADKLLYNAWMGKFMASVPRLTLAGGMATDLITEHGRIAGVVMKDGEGEGTRIGARAVICTTGTFLDGLMHCGEVQTPGGRVDEGSAVGLSDAFERFGLETGRLKTGTPARLHRDSINYEGLEPQPGDTPIIPFSFMTDRIERKQIDCHITWTNEATNEIVRANLDRSPLFMGVIKGVGPRYCPSFEDKVVRFADKTRHQIFLEPEGLDTKLVYPNGVSTCLPAEVQDQFLRAIPGLENVEIVRPGYAVEYTYCPPMQLRPSLEVRNVPGLYFAGQINGTSGYEEAGAQGLMAGINACLLMKDEPPVVFGRDEAYIGVLIDDLVTMEHREPYRMFTSRAEYRLQLRADNADLRLTPVGRRAGLVDDERWARFESHRVQVEGGISKLMTARVAPRDLEAEQWSSHDLPEPRQVVELGSYLARKEVTLEKLAGASLFEMDGSGRAAEQIELHFKYAHYITKQQKQIDRMHELRETALPEALDYAVVSGLKNESREKLARFRPATLAQASRIAGVTPADLVVLMIHLKARAEAA